MTHDPRILKVDTCRAYHSGYNVFVEVDIMLPKEMTLMEAHDIGEELQYKLESLPEVDRAFVHLDYEVYHKPEHVKRHTSE
jgi:divalent metal cation (Fe/Co/Zn/Cd) transporter